MSKLLERLASGEVLISDGGTGTYLQSHGLEAGGCPEAFNLTHAEIVRQMAADYFAAGSDMVETNTFGGNWFVLEKYGYADQVEQINRLAAEHASSAASEGRFVLGSVGPTGQFMVPVGSATAEQMRDVFAEQMRGLVAGGVDAFCIETMSDLAETAAAIRAASKTARLPIIATMTFDKGPRGYATMMGVTPEAAVQGLVQAGADIVGANCGLNIDSMSEIVAAMRAVTDKPILTHINAGMPQAVDGKTVFPDTPKAMASKLRQVVDAGANIVGGCCGTGPDHIRAFVAELRG